VTATTPTTKHKHADTNECLQDDVSNEKTTSRCRHRPSKNPDLGLHSEDLTFEKQLRQHLQQGKRHTEGVDSVGTDRRLPGKAFTRCFESSCLHPDGVAKLGQRRLPAPLIPDQPYLPPPSPLSVVRRPLDLRSHPCPLVEPHHNRSRVEVINQRRGSRHCGRTTPTPAPAAPPPPDHGEAQPEGAESSDSAAKIRRRHSSTDAPPPRPLQRHPCLQNAATRDQREQRE
jgi:hypothetical protein